MEPTSIIIRRATEADGSSLKALDTVVPIYPGRAESIDRWLRQDIVLVAEAEGQIVGYGVFNHEFFHQSQIDMLMIHPDYRGRRIGERLLCELELLCDTPKFFVTTNLSNRPMQSLLSRLGFKNCGFVDELDPGDPELIFFKIVKERNHDETAAVNTIQK